MEETNEIYREGGQQGASRWRHRGEAEGGQETITIGAAEERVWRRSTVENGEAWRERAEDGDRRRQGGRGLEAWWIRVSVVDGEGDDARGGDGVLNGGGQRLCSAKVDDGAEGGSAEAMRVGTAALGEVRRRLGEGLALTRWEEESRAANGDEEGGAAAAAALKGRERRWRLEREEAGAGAWRHGEGGRRREERRSQPTRSWRPSVFNGEEKQRRWMEAGCRQCGWRWRRSAELGGDFGRR